MRHIVIVLSWKRPWFLRRTLDSLAAVDPAQPVWVIDNGSDPDCCRLIDQRDELAGATFLPAHIYPTLLLDSHLPPLLHVTGADYLTICADDVHFQSPPSLAADLLEERPNIGTVSYQHSPEHPIFAEQLWRERPLILKGSERGTCLTMSAEFFRGLLPLPVHDRFAWDWWYSRLAPRCLARIGKLIGVLPGAALHMGWRQGDSPWQAANEIPEFDELRYPSNWVAVCPFCRSPKIQYWRIEDDRRQGEAIGACLACEASGPLDPESASHPWTRKGEIRP